MVYCMYMIVLCDVISSFSIIIATLSVLVMLLMGWQIYRILQFDSRLAELVERYFKTEVAGKLDALILEKVNEINNDSIQSLTLENKIQETILKEILHDFRKQSSENYNKMLGNIINSLSEGQNISRGSARDMIQHYF